MSTVLYNYRYVHPLPDFPHEKSDAIILQVIEGYYVLDHEDAILLRRLTHQSLEHSAEYS